MNTACQHCFNSHRNTGCFEVFFSPWGSTFKCLGLGCQDSEFGSHQRRGCLFSFFTRPSSPTNCQEMMCERVLLQLIPNTPRVFRQFTHFPTDSYHPPPFARHTAFMPYSKDTQVQRSTTSHQAYIIFPSIHQTLCNFCSYCGDSFFSAAQETSLLKEPECPVIGSSQNHSRQFWQIGFKQKMNFPQFQSEAARRRRS